MTGFDKYNFRRLARGQRWKTGINGPHTGRVYNPNGRKGNKGPSDSYTENNTKATLKGLLVLYLLICLVVGLIKGHPIIGFLGLVFGILIYRGVKSNSPENVLKLEKARKKDEAVYTLNNEVKVIKRQANVDIDDGWTEKQKEFAYLFNQAPESDYLSIIFRPDTEYRYDNAQSDLTLLRPTLSVKDSYITLFITPEFIFVQSVDSLWYRIPLEECEFSFNEMQSAISGIKPKDSVVKARYPNGRNRDINSEWTEQDWKYVCMVALFTINCKESFIEITASNIESYKKLARRLDNFRRKYYD